MLYTAEMLAFTEAGAYRTREITVCTFFWFQHRGRGVYESVSAPTGDGSAGGGAVGDLRCALVRRVPGHDAQTSGERGKVKPANVFR